MTGGGEDDDTDEIKPLDKCLGRIQHVRDKLQRQADFILDDKLQSVQTILAEYKEKRGGVRGREEIGEVYETAEDLDEALQREISTLEADKEAAQFPTPTITNTISILKGVRRRVLGVRDDL